ncbi:MAG TPA: MoaD/ThiS family protein [Ilumatobacteraceae bacterium]|nr:MoaD/ThiS family protein [Ilumatobacteraceae bacterium]
MSGESAMPCQRFTAFHSLWPCRMSSSERSGTCIPAEGTGADTLPVVAIVRLFASARQTAGTGRDELPGRTVAEVLDAARDRYGVAFGDVLTTCRIWVNGESVGEHTAIGPHDEVAILPPVSGGSC